MNKIVFLVALLPSGLLGQWMTGYYSSNNTAMPVSSIPWSKYTHIIHFAAAPALDAYGNGTGRLSMYYLNQGDINRFIASRPAGKKALVSIKVNDANFGAFAQSVSPALIGGFVNDIVSLVNNNGYDGVDIDWEHAVNASEYSDLLTRLRSALPSKLITMTSGDWENLDVIAAANYYLVDQVNVMCYDMDNPGAGDCNGSDCSWYNAPLTQGGDVWRRSCDLRVGRVVSKGVPPAKIGIGVPFYGRRHTGTTGPEVIGDFPMYTLQYRDMVSDPSRWQAGYMRYDAKHKAEYLSIPGYNEFIPFTGPQGLGDYVSWAKSQGFGGFMTFTLEGEFLPGASGDNQYPLSTILNSLLYSGAQAPQLPAQALPRAVVSPSSGAGKTQTFQFQATGSASDSSILQIDFTVGTGVGQAGSCSFSYWAPSRTLFIRSDSNSAWSAGQIGTGGTLSSAACSVNLATANAASSSNSLTLNVALTFAHYYAGSKSIFTFVADNLAKSSGWVNSGSFVVQ